MGVQVREKTKGSGVWWIFINHHSKRMAKRVGGKRNATQIADQIKAKLVLGEFDFGDKEKNTTFGDVAKSWMKTGHDWKLSTAENYQKAIENHLYPVFKDRPIRKITLRELKEYFDEKYKNGLSLSTLKTIRAPLSGIFRYAIEYEIIDRNPVRDQTLKYRKRSFEITPLDEQEAAAFLEQAQLFLDGKYYPPLLCALRTGMRVGELQALKWKDIDFDNRIIEVRRGWRRGRITRTKNKKSRRVDMTPLLADIVKTLRTQQKRDALRESKPVPEFVFTGVKQDFMARNSLRYAIHKCCDMVGLRKLRTHDLRHSYATIRLMRGHNIGDVSYQLGHSSIKITYDVYAHWVPGSFKSEVDDLDNPSTMQNCVKGGCIGGCKIE